MNMNVLHANMNILHIGALIALGVCVLYLVALFATSLHLKRKAERDALRAEIERLLNNALAPLKPSHYELNYAQRQTLMRIVQEVSDNDFEDMRFPRTGDPAIDCIFDDLCRKDDPSICFGAYAFLEREFPCFRYRADKLDP